jgi:hypothetical protein
MVDWIGPPPSRVSVQFQQIIGVAIAVALTIGSPGGA